MTTHMKQGSPEWIAHRTKHCNASDLAAARGNSPYESRDALIARLATGITPEFSEYTLKIFAEGCESEARARPLVQLILTDVLTPTVFSAEIDDVKLSASLDGITMCGGCTWEHKQHNKALVASMREGYIPSKYRYQMEQGLMLSGATHCYFTTFDENDEIIGLWYEPNLELRAEIVPTWKHLLADVAAYVVPTPEPVVIAAPEGDLPSVFVNVSGEIGIVSNLTAFGAKLTEYIDKINLSPSDDQEFADAESAIKTLEKAETALKTAESSALAQTASVDELVRTIAAHSELSRKTRLVLTRVVKDRKEQIRASIVMTARELWKTHFEALNDRLGMRLFPGNFAPDFAEAAKGRKFVSTTESAVSDALATAKVASSEEADRVSKNIRWFKYTAEEYKFLFHDLSSIVSSQAEAFQAIVTSRIDAHKKGEAEKEVALREKIRAEEEAKAKREAERTEEEAKAKAIAKTATPEQATAPAPSAVIETEDAGERINISEIRARLGFSVDAEFLESVGFPAEISRNSKLYRANDFSRICCAISEHCMNAASISW